jgi:hypothetical protein
MFSYSSAIINRDTGEPMWKVYHINDKDRTGPSHMCTPGWTFNSEWLPVTGRERWDFLAYKTRANNLIEITVRFMPIDPTHVLYDEQREPLFRELQRELALQNIESDRLQDVEIEEESPFTHCPMYRLIGLPMPADTEPMPTGQEAKKRFPTCTPDPTTGEATWRVFHINDHHQIGPIRVCTPGWMFNHKWMPPLNEQWDFLAYKRMANAKVAEAVRRAHNGQPKGPMWQAVISEMNRDTLPMKVNPYFYRMQQDVEPDFKSTQHLVDLPTWEPAMNLYPHAKINSQTGEPMWRLVSVDRRSSNRVGDFVTPNYKNLQPADSNFMDRAGGTSYKEWEQYIFRVRQRRDAEKMIAYINGEGTKKRPLTTASPFNLGLGSRRRR